MAHRPQIQCLPTRDCSGRQTAQPHGPRHTLPQHNLTGLDTRCLSTIVFTHTHHASAPLSMPHHYSPSPAPHLGAKCGAPRDFAQPVPKQARSDSRCFRCGGTSHLPSACTASVTGAGRHVCSVDLQSRSPNALVATNGKTFCFSWAAQGSCCYGAGCCNEHSCSLLGGAAHGVGICDQV